MCRERVGKGSGKGRVEAGGWGREGLCSIAAVYIYVDFMSVCLSCLGITEIVRHFFVCLSMRVCVCLYFLAFCISTSFCLLLFLCVFTFSPLSLFRISFTVFVLLQQHVMQQTISYKLCVCVCPLYTACA